MDIIELVGQYGAWSWIVGGIILLGIELLVPGSVFIWLGIAAVITGIASLIQTMSIPVQWALFGILSLASLGAWLTLMRRRKNINTDSPHLNKRGQALVGRQAVLIDNIENGFGRVRLGDTVWRVSGPQLSAGANVTVTGHSGAVLEVEPSQE